VLANLVFDAAASSVSIDDGMAAIAALEREETEAVRRELTSRIRDAEPEGRIAEAMELTPPNDFTKANATPPGRVKQARPRIINSRNSRQKLCTMEQPESSSCLRSR